MPKTKLNRAVVGTRERDLPVCSKGFKKVVVDKKQQSIASFFTNPSKPTPLDEICKKDSKACNLCNEPMITNSASLDCLSDSAAGSLDLPMEGLGINVLVSKPAEETSSSDASSVGLENTRPNTEPGFTAAEFCKDNNTENLDVLGADADAAPTSLPAPIPAADPLAMETTDLDKGTSVVEPDQGMPQIADQEADVDVGKDNHEPAVEELLSALETYEKSKTTRKHYRGYFLDNIDKRFLLGRNVRVYWPLDEVWYSGQLIHYDPATRKHTVKYLDGETEKVDVGKEMIRVESCVGEVFPVQLNNDPEFDAAPPAAPLQPPSNALICPASPRASKPAKKAALPKSPSKPRTRPGCRSAVVLKRQLEATVGSGRKLPLVLPWELVGLRVATMTRHRNRPDYLEYCKVLGYCPDDWKHELLYDGEDAPRYYRFVSRAVFVIVRDINVRVGVDFEENTAEIGGVKNAVKNKNKEVREEVMEEKKEMREEKNDIVGAACPSIPTDINTDPLENMVEVESEFMDPMAILGGRIAVYWADDYTFYPGTVHSYSARTRRHMIKYDDGVSESLHLQKERFKLHPAHALDAEGCPLPIKLISEVPAPLPPTKPKPVPKEAVCEMPPDSTLPRPGEVVWGKMHRHPAWVAVVWTEADAAGMVVKSLAYKPDTVPVQFFGTHEVGRLKQSQIFSMKEGLERQFHLGSSRSALQSALAECKAYMSTGELVEEMGGGEWHEPLWVLESNDVDDASEAPPAPAPGEPPQWPMRVSSTLQLCSPGTIDYLHPEFHNAKYIYPVGFKVFRTEIMQDMRGKKAPEKYQVTCEIRYCQRGPEFVTTLDDGAEFPAADPTSAFWAAWQELARRNKRDVGEDASVLKKSGVTLFGLRCKEVAEVIQALPGADRCERYRGWLGARPPVPALDAQTVRAQAAKRAPSLHLPPHITPIPMPESSGLVCAVCNMDEEYEHNQFVQCDKCGIMVHMECYGITEPPNGELWLCTLCELGLEKNPPPCVVCPVIGGALKPTNCGRWAHITCAMWVPDLSFMCVERMEPICGVPQIEPARAKLKCVVCDQCYGACIQCTSLGCFSAYHPLCARFAGYHTSVRKESKLEQELASQQKLSVAARIHLGIAVGNGLRLMSLCKKCAPAPPPPLLVQRPALPVGTRGESLEASSSGGLGDSARTRPIDWALRRNRREPAAVAAALAKREFVRSTPYVVSGCRRPWRVPAPAPAAAVPDASADLYANEDASSAAPKPPKSPEKPLKKRKSLLSLHSLKSSENGNHGPPAQPLPPPSEARGLATGRVLSITEKYRLMQATTGVRITMGKSAIHGWGVFTKQPHKKNDMVVEYAGEVVRPSVADMREHHSYNSLVGAGTYIFALDGSRNVDATKTGTIAHLINHSCQPNCFTRIVSAHGDSRIVIFASRDLEAGVELTYDYRFTSQSELLACNCGVANCRGMVNVLDPDFGLVVPRAELSPWDGNSGVATLARTRAGGYRKRSRRQREAWE